MRARSHSEIPDPFAATVMMAPTATTCGIPGDPGRIANSVGSALLGAEAALLRGRARRLPYGHTLVALAVLLVAIVGSAIWARSQWRNSLPALDGTRRLAGLGARVTVIEAATILARDDHELVAVLRRRLVADGIDLREGAKVAGVTRSTGGICARRTGRLRPDSCRSWS